jgi:acyl-CoA thioester hydrolase
MAHETTVRTRYGEVDRMGVVYHAHYLAYFEAGRTEYLRSIGRTYRDVEDGGVLLVVADAGLRFHRPAGYDDVLRVRTRVASVSGVRVRFEYEVERSRDGVLIATGHTTLASTDREARPVRMPADLRETLERHLEPSAAPLGSGEGPGSGEGRGGGDGGKIEGRPAVQGRVP